MFKRLALTGISALALTSGAMANNFTVHLRVCQNPPNPYFAPFVDPIDAITTVVDGMTYKIDLSKNPLKPGADQTVVIKGGNRQSPDLCKRSLTVTYSVGPNTKVFDDQLVGIYSDSTGSGVYLGPKDWSTPHFVHMCGPKVEPPAKTLPVDAGNQNYWTFRIAFDGHTPSDMYPNHQRMVASFGTGAFPKCDNWYGYNGSQTDNQAWRAAHP